ncbi:hypothetical protein BaRGS_00033199 [Batillaria attramentaria]|uniref:ERAP1-like C-terminal domain-containing protein n=1 Tax=Batillaria attramentaria TaxID=370345 RepID=A0ABD0JL09_9CAEN
MFSGDIRSQDALGIVQYVAQNPAGRSVAWQFIRDSWTPYLTAAGDGGPLCSRILTLARCARASQAALESVRSNIRWMDNNYAIVQQWLATLGYYKA